jgi:hypothetical protein
MPAFSFIEKLKISFDVAHQKFNRRIQEKCVTALVIGNFTSRDLCYDFKNIFAEKNCKKISIFCLKTLLNEAKFLS